MISAPGHELSASPLDGEGRSELACSCGYLSGSLPQSLLDLYARTHIAKETRPAVALAFDIGHVVRMAGYRGELTRGQADTIASALRVAADVADGVDVARSREMIVDMLVKLVRGGS